MYPIPKNNVNYMLSFFNQKKIPLTAVFPKNFVDIHSHLLPNLDDGSKSLEETVALLKRMQRYGITNFIFTPHCMEGIWENSSEVITEKLNILKEHLKGIGMKDLNIQTAAEYMLDNNFAQILKTEKLLTLKDNKILVEMSYMNAPVNLYQTLVNIQMAGYQPILAHPERYFFYHRNFNEYYKLKKAGCLFQLNLLSLSNYYGKDVQKIAIQLLKKNMIDFVGTDTHNPKHLDHLEKINNKKIIQLIKPILENNTHFFN